MVTLAHGPALAPRQPHIASRPGSLCCEAGGGRNQPTVLLGIRGTRSLEPFPVAAAPQAGTPLWDPPSPCARSQGHPESFLA